MARSLTTWMTIRYWIPGEINGSVGSGVVINCWWGFVKLAGSAETGGHTKSCANRSSRPWAPMKPGQVVVTQHMLSRRWDQQATILESCSNGHSYIVKINGRSFPSRPIATTEISQEVATLIEILWSNLTLAQNSSWIWLSAGTPMLVLSSLARIIDWFLSLLLLS